jgi:hypothetical protein
MLGELKLPAGGIGAVDAPLEMSLIADIPNFQMSANSPDGLWIEGFNVVTSTRAIYSMHTGEVTPILLDGAPVASGSDPAWIGNQRVLMWVPRHASAVVWDVTQQRATRLPDLPGPATYVHLPGQNTLLANILKENSEIWLITLQDDSPG